MNDKLWTGPDLLQNFVGIIFKFREHQIALIDKEAMLLQVKVPPKECRVLRFLWRSRPENRIGVYKHTRYVFGAKSSPTCAIQALLQAGVDNKEGHPVAAKAIRRTFYMDDFAKTVAAVDEAVHVYQDVKMTLQMGRISLLKWICKSEFVTRSIPEKNRSEEKCKTFDEEPHTSSILGMQ